MQPEKVKVIIADDHPAIRYGFRALFDRKPDIEIVGEAADGREAIELVEKLQPDILLLDMQMPVMDGLQVLDYLRKCGSKVRILIVSAYDDQSYITEILTHGGWGYYMKDEAPTIIVEAVLQAAQGKNEGTRPRPTTIERNKL